MKNKSLTLARAGRAALLFIAVVSVISLVSDLSLSMDGRLLLDRDLLIMRIIIGIISWSTIYSLRNKFNELKKEIKPIKFGLSLFGSYISIFILLSVIIVLFGYITGTNSHFNTQWTYNKLQEENGSSSSLRDSITDEQWEAIEKWHLKVNQEYGNNNSPNKLNNSKEINGTYYQLEQLRKDGDEEKLEALLDSLTDEEYSAVKALQSEMKKRNESFQKMKYLYAFLIFLFLRIFHKGYRNAKKEAKLKGSDKEIRKTIFTSSLSLLLNYNFLLLEFLKFLPIAFIIYFLS